MHTSIKFENQTCMHQQRKQKDTQKRININTTSLHYIVVISFYASFH